MFIFAILEYAEFWQLGKWKILIIQAMAVLQTCLWLNDYLVAVSQDVFFKKWLVNWEKNN